MNAQPGSPDNLEDDDEMGIARFSERARADTIGGGAGALCLAKELVEVVNDVYSRSTGKTSEKYGAWECRECGETHLGKEAADQCCNEGEDE